MNETMLFEDLQYTVNVHNVTYQIYFKKKEREPGSAVRVAVAA